MLLSQNPKPKIVFYKQRSFGEKMNASFDFLRENWKVMLKYLTYFILPLCLIQGLSLNTLIFSLFDMAAFTDPYAMGGLESFGAKFFISYFFFLICVMLGGLMMSSLIYACIQLYNDREERLVGVTFNDLRPYFFRNIKRSLIVTLFSIGLGVILVLLIAVISVAAPLLIILVMFGLIAIAIPLSLFLPIYLFEKESLINAFGKAIRIGFATWGGIFAVVFVMGFIGGILQSITMMPWYILVMIKAILTTSDSAVEITNSVLYTFGTYLLSILQGFGMYLSLVFTYIGLAYQYSHATEKMDNVSIESDIDKFEQL